MSRTLIPGVDFGPVFPRGGLLLWLRADDLAGADGSAVSSWSSREGNAYDFAQATGANQPTLQTAEIGGKSVVEFDGTNDYLQYAGLILTGTAAGTIGGVIKTGASSFINRGKQAIISVADNIAIDVVQDAGELIIEDGGNQIITDTTSTTWYELGIDETGRLYWDYKNTAGTQHRLVGSTNLRNSTVYRFMITWSGVDYYTEVDDIEENPLTIDSIGTAGWFGNITTSSETVIGGTLLDAGLTRPFEGQIAELFAWSVDLTA